MSIDPNLSEPIPAAPLRDWTVLEAIKAALDATAAFDEVAIGQLPEDLGVAAGIARFAVLSPGDWDEIDVAAGADDADSETAVENEVRMRFTLTLEVRDGDAVARDRELDRLLAACKNAINGAELISGRTVPGWTKLRRGRWERPDAPSRRMTVVGETAYTIDGDDEHDEDEV